MNQPVADGAAVSPKWLRRDLIIVALAGLVFYALNVDFWIYGDSALYADYSTRRKFTEVTLHLGYYWMVIAAHATAGALFRIPIQETMAWLNVLAGTGVLCVAYLLALQLLGTRRNAIVTVIVLALSGRMITNATSSEVYITQTLFVLASFYFFTRERVALAAAGAACAMLVSPLSVFAFLFYPAYDYQRAGRVRWAVLAKLAAFSLLMYSPYLTMYGHDLLWGRRGLLTIGGQTPHDPMLALQNFPKYQFKQYTALLLLFVPTLFAFRKHARLFALSAAVAIPHLYIIFKLPAEDNVFILNTDFFFAALVAIGWAEISQRKFVAWLGPAALLAHSVLLVASGSVFSFKHRRDYAAEMRGVFDNYLRHKNAAIIMDWGTAVVFTYYGRTSADTTLIEEPIFDRIYDLENTPQSDPNVLEAEELYVLDRWNPTPLNKFLSSKRSLEEQAHEHALKNIAERRLNLTCSLLQERTNRLYRCTRNIPPSS